jgi:hypothetical protein
MNVKINALSRNKVFVVITQTLEPCTYQFRYRVSQKWRTNGVLRCRRDYRKRQKNVKKILLDLFTY